jgi:hypothetical protein
MSSINSTYGVTAAQVQAMRLLLEGKSEEEVAIIAFDVRDETGSEPDPAKVKKAVDVLHKWQRDPKVQECWRRLLVESVRPDIVRALKRIARQIDDENGWLANKAANDLLTRFASQIIGEDENTTVIRVEGLPELGIPGGDNG